MRYTRVGVLILGVSSGCSDDGPPREPGAGGVGGDNANAGAGGNDPAVAVVCRSPSESLAWPDDDNAPVPADNSWKSTLEIPTDSFFSATQADLLGAMAWVKFIILTSAPDQVYFQDSAIAPFHYDFASQRIPKFQGMTRAQFDAVSLGSEGRMAVLGALVMPLDRVTFPEYGVQIVSNDDVHPELVERVMNTVTAHVTAPAGTTATYLPSGPAAECVDSKRDNLTARGVSVGSIDRWLRGDGCYSMGWAVGKLVKLPAAEIDAAYLDRRLTPDDIVLIEDTAPAELPFVSGILTLEPSTPNAHSAILARSFGVPFAYVRQPETQALASTHEGKQVIVSTFPARGRDPFSNEESCVVRLIDASDLTAQQVAEIRVLGRPDTLDVAAKQPLGVLTRVADGLVPSDIIHVGGKAANFGVLRTALPDVTPHPAIALTFDLWDAFLDGCRSFGTAMISTI